MKYNGRTTMAKEGALGGTCKMARAVNIAQLFPKRSEARHALGGALSRLAGGVRCAQGLEQMGTFGQTRAFAKGSRARRENLPQSAVAARSDKRGSGGGPQER